MVKSVCIFTMHENILIEKNVIHKKFLFQDFSSGKLLLVILQIPFLPLVACWSSFCTFQFLLMKDSVCSSGRQLA